MKEFLGHRPEQILEPDRHIGGGGVQSGASGSSLGHGARSFVVGADEQMAALLLAWKERRVLHVERVESALRKKGCVLFVRGGLEGIAEEIEGDIRVERGGTGSAAETLIWQPSPAGAVVGKGEVRGPREVHCPVLVERPDVWVARSARVMDWTRLGTTTWRGAKC